MKLFSRLLAALTALIMLTTLLAGCKNTSYVLTVNNEKVTRNEYLYILKSAKSSFLYNMNQTYSQFGMSFDDSDDTWSLDWGEGTTFGETVQEQALNNAISLMLIRQLWNELELSFTEEEQKEIDQEIQNVIDSNFSGNKDEYLDYLDSMNLNEKQGRLLLFEDLFKERKIKDVLWGKDGKNPVSYDDARKYFDDNYRKLQYLSIETTDSSTGDALEADVRADREKTKDDYLARLDAGEDFKTIIKEYWAKLDAEEAALSEDETSGDEDETAGDEDETAGDEDETAGDEDDGILPLFYDLNANYYNYPENSEGNYEAHYAAYYAEQELIGQFGETVIDVIRELELGAHTVFEHPNGYVILQRHDENEDPTEYEEVYKEDIYQMLIIKAYNEMLDERYKDAVVEYNQAALQRYTTSKVKLPQ